MDGGIDAMRVHVHPPTPPATISPDVMHGGCRREILCRALSMVKSATLRPGGEEETKGVHTQ